MTQNQYIAALSEKLGISKDTVRKVLNAQADVLREALQEDGKAIIPGLGSVSLRHKPAGVRKIFGEERQVEASTKLSIRPNKQLKADLGAK